MIGSGKLVVSLKAINQGFNNNGHERDLQHCKSTLTITKSKSNNNIKLSIINCLAFQTGCYVLY